MNHVIFMIDGSSQTQSRRDGLVSRNSETLLRSDNLSETFEPECGKFEQKSQSVFSPKVTPWFFSDNQEQRQSLSPTREQQTYSGQEPLRNLWYFSHLPVESAEADLQGSSKSKLSVSDLFRKHLSSVTDLWVQTFGMYSLLKFSR